MNSCMNCLEEKQICNATTGLHSVYENLRCKGKSPDEAIAEATKIMGEVYALPIPAWQSWYVTLPLVLLIGSGIVGGSVYGLWWYFNKLIGGDA